MFGPMKKNMFIFGRAGFWPLYTNDTVHGDERYYVFLGG